MGLYVDLLRLRPSTEKRLVEGHTGGYNPNMRLQLFAFKLPAEHAEQLRQISKLYSPSGSCGILLRDMVSAAVSGEAQAMASFNARLLGRLGEQLTLNILQDKPRAGDPAAGTRKRGEARGKSGKAKKRKRRKTE